MPMQEVPDLRPKFWRRLAFPMVVALTLLALGGVVYYYQTYYQNSRKALVQPTPEANATTPVRPMVETLPTVAGTDHAATNNGKASQHVGETPRPQERESDNSADEASSGKRKNRGTSGEKRAILRQENGNEGGPSKRSNPFADKPAVKKDHSPRPNPF